MSDTAPTTPTTPTPPAVAPTAQPQAASAGWFNAVITGIEHGANTVYHRVVAVEEDVTKWETSNPELTALVSEGLAYAESFLTRMGVPVGAVVIVGSDILAAMKALAAADPTVPSGGGSP
jgi:hypothetical protein